MLVGEIFFIVIVIWIPCILCDRWDDQETRRFVEEYIPKLKQNLRRADDVSDENYMRSKTITKNNRHYDVHLIKLKNVNGLKRHNLIVKEKSDDNPLIYVINPVETKIPHAFVSQKEFKDILNNRVKKQRNEVYEKGDPLLPVNSTYWTKISWSKPALRSMKFPYQHLFKRRQHNAKPVVTTTKKPINRKNVSLKYINPYIHHIRTGNSKAKIHKTKDLRSNKTSKAKTNKIKYLRSNRTSKVKEIKIQYLRSNRTSKAIRNKAITLKNNGTVKAKTIYLRSNRSIITKRNKKILKNLSTKPMFQTDSHIFKKDQNISITEEISKAKIIGKKINETIERQTFKEIATEKPTTDNELPPTKNEVTSTTKVFTIKKQAIEEDTIEKPTNLDITTEKLKADEKTKIESAKTVIENTAASENEGETTVVPTESEITTEKLTKEDKTTKERTHTETVNIEHSKEEKESMPTEKTVETPATEDTTKSSENTNSNTESVNTEDQEVDLSTDQSKDEKTTERKLLPFRTTVVKRTTTRARILTTRSRLSRPLVFMGDMGNGNS